MIEEHVLGLDQLDRTMIAAVGGKGANLGELSRIDGVSVPPGFCVTTAAFQQVMAQVSVPDELSRLKADDRDTIGTLSADVRRSIEAIEMPADLADAITAALTVLGTDAAVAVRSSATAEDLPTASFAGQQDSFLNVTGADAVLNHVRRCWASLFTDRAVTYRLRNGFDHRQIRMAVVVQRMVVPEASGVMFTADPVTGNRKLATVDAGCGLGEALVSGLVNPDVFTVRDGELVSKAIAADRPSLTDAQAVRLVELGRTIEAHFGSPQDIEWCLAGDEFQIVQSRPITTLYPIPETADGGNHVFLSVGHQQMMTDAMKPLGVSCWQLTAMAPMLAAGGRLFVDATPRLTSPAVRAGFMTMVTRADPLFGDALQTVLDRGDFIPSLPAEPGAAAAAARPAAAPPGHNAPIETDPAIVAGLIARDEDSVAKLRRDIHGLTGPALFDFLREAFEEHKRLLTDPLNFQAIMAGMDATDWLNTHLADWLVEQNAADRLTLSAPGNITSEMGLALLDVADVIRPHPEVVAHLQAGRSLDELPTLPGGPEAHDAIQAYLDRYGMRCAGEIDITRTRWSEDPAALVPLILDHVRTFAPGEAARRFALGAHEAAEKERDVLSRLRAQPDGDRRADETKRMIDRVRTFIGYREYPKYGIIARYFVYKQALMAEADRLVHAGVLRSREDAFYLTFQEFHEVARTRQADERLIRRREAEHRIHQALVPPRVITSDGEILTGSYRRDDVPPGALPGLPVSAGVVEGRARVLHDMAHADLEPGDILVTAYTDPSWSPLFVSIAGLVTEIGGLMTHGAVIAREYGLPAVVGVEGATRLIPDGSRVRVHGISGYVELLP
ncbi:rifamycin-inactivating phosphotransferase [Catenuloplanes japonicus]|uniref:rifamycin-inactivating phosphotransferase n=1 Tax=Catenuloplanes japonicus TaxID=33876 RepID=UPI000526C53E|nr:rifamycin-inactivating phosphotransferase [Catenuloplanes japonicus]